VASSIALLLIEVDVQQNDCTRTASSATYELQFESGIATAVLLIEQAIYLLPIARFGGLVWLIAAGSMLPNRRSAQLPAPMTRQAPHLAGADQNLLSRKQTQYGHAKTQRQVGCHERLGERGRHDDAGAVMDDVPPGVRGQDESHQSATSKWEAIRDMTAG
jgi:hypothetical protein